MFWRHKSFEVLPALSVRGPELRQSMRLVIIAGMYGVAWLACISGSHVKIFARMLGFNDLAFGLLSAIPFVATFAQLPAAIIIERTGLRKYQFLYCMGIGRALWFVVPALPFILPIPSTWAVAAMLVLLAVSWSTSALGMPAWLSWMGDLIPRRVRGRYLGTRVRLGAITQLLVIIALGVVLDAVAVEGRPETYEAQPRLMWVICGILLVGAAFGTWNVIVYRRVREIRPSRRDGPPPGVRIEVPPPAGRSPQALIAYVFRYFAAAVGQLLVDPLRDRVFRHYVCYGAMVAFAMTAGGWFFWLNAMENLGYSKLGANVIFLGTASLAGIAASRLWGRLLDRWGRRPTLLLATVGIIFSAMPWLLVRRDTPAPAVLVLALNWLSGRLGAIAGQPGWQWVTPETPVTAYLAGIAACVIGGVCWTGVNLSKVNIMMGFADGHGRSKYIAASSVLISVGGILGGVVGGTVAQSLKHLQSSPIVLGPFLWKNWHFCFMLSIAARAGSILWLIGMPDPGAGRFRDLVRVLGANAYNAASTRLFYPLRVFDWGRRRRNGRNGPRQERRNGKSSGPGEAG